GLNAEVISANPIVNSGFGHYLKDIPAQLLAGTDFLGQMRQPLQLVQPGQSGFQLSFAKPLPLGDHEALNVSAGAAALLTVHNRSGKRIFEDTFLGVPITVRAGQAYVSFLFAPTLSVYLSQQSGKLTFGFGFGTSAELRCFQLFDLTDQPPTLREA